MNKLFFMNDYGEGAHPLVMQRLMETNLEHTCGYGLDEYSLRAQKLLIEKKIIKTVADGDYGPRTELGVSTFQQMAGLEVTGIAYPETIEALKNWNVQ